MSLKSTLKKRFRAVYPRGARLLAVHLNGFSHSVIYDAGTRSSKIITEEYSGCMPEGNFRPNARDLFHDIGHNRYKDNPEEIIYIMPGER